MEMNLSKELTRERIYLAGPFFNGEQVATQMRMEILCERYQWPFFSPRLECLVTKESSMEMRRQAFFMNVHSIRTCRLVLANVEGLDTGTIWEMGAAYAYNRKVVVYSPDPQRKLNLMLAQGADGFLAGWEAIGNFLRPVSENNFNWAVMEAKWTKEVF